MSDSVQTVYQLPLQPNIFTPIRSLYIYRRGAGLAVTGPVRHIGQNVLQPAFEQEAAAAAQVEVRLKREGTRAETRFGLSGKRTSTFKSAGQSVESSTGSRGERITGQR
jgi:hypothetical protein